MQQFSSLLVIGCGKMGGAVLNGALNKGLCAQNIRTVEPDAAIRASLKEKGLISSADINDFHDFSPDVVFLAVKPFLAESVIGGLRHFTDKGAALVSIVAGKKIAWYEEKLGSKAAVFRAMPNTPAAVGKGITGLMAGSQVSAKQKEAAESLFSACGEVVWLENEKQMDAVTAISGSGPAYVFYLTEALAEAALSLGLAKETAEKLAKATVCGAAGLMDQSTDAPEILRRNVTTPNGTTAAALEILTDRDKGFTPLMKKAAAAAEKRSEELSKV